MRAKEPNPAFSLGVGTTEEGMRTVYRAADPVWKATALEKIEELAREQETFIVDDVWVRLPRHVTTFNNKAMGPALRRAVAIGFIERTGEWRYTYLPGRHSHLMPVWRSRIYGDPDFL